MTFMVPSLKWKEKMSNNVKVFKAYVCEFKLETTLATFITFSYSFSNKPIYYVARVRVIMVVFTCTQIAGT